MSYGCAAYLPLAEVAAGDSVETYRVALSVRDILGDSLPPGRYRVLYGADLKLKGALSAGEVMLGQ